MKRGVNYWMVGGFEGETPAVEAAKIAQSMGYEGIQLSFGLGELTTETPKKELSAIRREMERMGMGVASLSTGAFWAMSLGSPNEEERGAAVAFTEAYLHAAHALGTDCVLVVPGTVDVGWNPRRPVVPAGTVWERAQQSIASLLPVAEKAKVRIGIENVWNKFLTGPFEYVSFIDSFDSPWVGSYFDVGNALISGYPEHWIDLLGGRILRVHAKNFRRRDGGGTLNDFTTSLLEGDANWPEIFRALKAVGYDGFLTAEVIVGEAPMPNLDQAARVCEELQQLIEQYG